MNDDVDLSKHKPCLGFRLLALNCPGSWNEGLGQGFGSAAEPEVEAVMVGRMLESCIRILDVPRHTALT